MEIFKQNLYFFSVESTELSSQLQNSAFLFAKENHLRLNVFNSQLLLQLLNCSSPGLSKRQ